MGSTPHPSYSNVFFFLFISHDPIDPPTRPTKAFGHYYHPEHLTCTHCHKPVDEHTTGMVRHKRRIYCRPDFNRLYLPTCRGCGRAVERKAVSSLDGKMTGQWHQHCFRCHACHASFENKTFYVHNNHPYCQRDYHRLNHSLCGKCDLPIEGRCAQTCTGAGKGEKYHPHCFTCHVSAMGRAERGGGERERGTIDIDHLFIIMIRNVKNKSRIFIIVTSNIGSIVQTMGIASKVINELPSFMISLLINK